MKALGISAFSHDASACLIDNFSIVAFAEEERFNREKHTARFPAAAIQFCLAQGKLSLAEVDEIAFFWRPIDELTGNLAHFLKYLPESRHLLRATGTAEPSFLGRSLSALRLRAIFRQHFPAGKIPPIRFYDHHLCHAASAYYCSKFPEAAVLVLDGRGESVCTSIWHGSGGTLKRVFSIKVPHSLGFFYAAITDHLGFRPFRDKWRVMGLAGYGQPTFKERLSRLSRTDDKNGY